MAEQMAKGIVVRDGVKTEVGKTPFFVSDEEKKGLEDVPQENLAEPLKEAIPEFNHVDKGEVKGSYGYKDGILIYHVYKADRKGIYDVAHAALDEAKTDAEQQEISRSANAALAVHPWWPDTEKILTEIFSEHFKYSPNKVTYYPEVDSWSVIMPEPKGVAVPSSHLEAVFAKIALRVEG